jgi:hypothetical protein
MVAIPNAVESSGKVGTERLSWWKQGNGGVQKESQTTSHWIGGEEVEKENKENLRSDMKTKTLNLEIDMWSGDMLNW